ncbi:hypothetical protein RJZ57_006548 [Blastomyces gilchristii]
MLGVEYGMRPVGAIRIITPQNQADTVWQEWQKFPYSSQGQLVDPKKYFTLSYVWGKTKMLLTMKANLQDCLKENSLINEKKYMLPQTIKDAMSIVRSLGEKYLWIDVICIVQDDLNTKHHDIRHMDIVYGKSFVTIAAMHGNDATARLPGNPSQYPASTGDRINRGRARFPNRSEVKTPSRSRENWSTPQKRRFCPTIPPSWYIAKNPWKKQIGRFRGKYPPDHHPDISSSEFEHEQQAVLRLEDKKGRHCGLIFDTTDDFVRQTFVKQHKGTKVNKQESSELVAIFDGCKCAHEIRRGL